MRDVALPSNSEATIALTAAPSLDFIKRCGDFTKSGTKLSAALTHALEGKGKHFPSGKKGRITLKVSRGSSETTGLVAM